MNYFNSHSEGKKALLSTLWIFVLINLLFRDLQEFLKLGVSYINGAELLLMGGIVLQLQIAMVALSRMLPEAINRWANLMVAILSILVVATTSHNGLGNALFATTQIIGLISIIWVALSTIRLEDLINFIDMPTRP